MTPRTGGRVKRNRTVRLVINIRDLGKTTEGCFTVIGINLYPPPVNAWSKGIYFVKCWQTRLQLKSCSFKTFLLKLALLSALARKKWILLFRQNVWRENQANQPRKLSRQTTLPSFIQIQIQNLKIRMCN